MTIIPKRPAGTGLLTLAAAALMTMAAARMATAQAMPATGGNSRPGKTSGGGAANSNSGGPTAVGKLSRQPMSTGTNGGPNGVSVSNRQGNAPGDNWGVGTRRGSGGSTAFNSNAVSTDPGIAGGPTAAAVPQGAATGNPMPQADGTDAASPPLPTPLPAFVPNRVATPFPSPVPSSRPGYPGSVIVAPARGIGRGSDRFAPVTTSTLAGTPSVRP